MAEPNPSAFTQWKTSSPWTKLKTILVALFIVFHCGTALAWGSGKSTRTFLRAYTFWYSKGFRLHGTWKLFSRPRNNKSIFVVAIDKGGKRHKLSPLPNRSAFELFLEVRERKLRTKISKKRIKHRFAPGYLRTFCAPEYRTIELRKLSVKDMRKGKKSSKLIDVTCRGVRDEN